MRADEEAAARACGEYLARAAQHLAAAAALVDSAAEDMDALVRGLTPNQGVSDHASAKSFGDEQAVRLAQESITDGRISEPLQHPAKRLMALARMLRRIGDEPKASKAEPGPWYEASEEFQRAAAEAVGRQAALNQRE